MAKGTRTEGKKKKKKKAQGGKSLSYSSKAVFPPTYVCSSVRASPDVGDVTDARAPVCQGVYCSRQGRLSLRSVHRKESLQAVEEEEEEEEEDKKEEEEEGKVEKVARAGEVGMDRGTKVLI